MNHLLFATLLSIVLFFSSFSVQGQIKIKVWDQRTSTPVEDVIISWRQGQVITDQAGEALIPEGVLQLELSRTGYQALKINLVEPTNPLLILLAPNADLEEFTVTAYPVTVNSESAPASYSLIPKERINIANNIEYGDVLNNVPGVFMHTGTLGTNRITIRGIGARTPFSTNRIRAYYNEIPLTAGDGETTLEDNELGTLGNIEVIKGPAATAYGAGLGGLIKLRSGNNEESYFSTTYGIGSFGLSRTKNTLQLSNGEHFVKASFATTFAEGFRDNNQYDRENFTLNYRLEGKKVQLELLSTLISVKGFIPSSLNLTDFTENPSVAAANWAAVQGFEDYNRGLVGLTATAEISESQTLSGTVYTTFRNNFELRPFGILTEKSNLYGTRWKYENQLDEAFRLAAGGEYTVENFELTTLDQQDREPTDLTSFNQQLRRSVNVFAEGFWTPTDRWQIIGGVNLSRVNYTLDDLFRQNGDQSGDFSFSTILSPRVFVGYRPGSGKTLLYGQVSRGFSAPSVEETLTPDGLINTDIQPETGYNFEIGSRGSFLLENLNYQVNAYLLSVRNLLVARRTAEDQFIGINAGRTLHRGLEFELNYDQRIGRFHLRPFGNFSTIVAEFREFVDLDEDFEGNNLPGVPDFTANLGLLVNADFGLYATANYRAVGEMFLRDDNLLNSSAYQILNIKLGYQRSFGKFSFDVNGGINNVLDEVYASQILINAGSFGGNAPRYFYPGNPRNYYGNLQLRYDL